MGGESKFHKTTDGAETSVVFALTEGVGALAEALKVFKVRKIFVKEYYKSSMKFFFFMEKRCIFQKLFLHTESSNKPGFNSIPIFQKI